MHYYDKEVVCALLDMGGCIRLMRDVLIDYSAGRTIQTLRSVLPVSERKLLGLMPAANTAAGIMGVKKTSELIPLCHPLMINKVNIDFDVDRANCLIYAYCTVKCNGKTGVEMEALTGVNVCLLTIYDMCKVVSKDMEIKNVHLVSKSGGKSGDFVWKE